MRKSRLPRRRTDSDLEDHGPGLQHEHEPDERQEQDLPTDERDDRERRPERERTRIAHEDLGRVHVEPEERQDGADDERAEERQVGRVGDVDPGLLEGDRRDDEVPDEREDERAAREAVEAVGDVHRVARGDDRERRDEDVEPGRDRDGPDERHEQRRDLIGVLDLPGCDPAHDRLPEQLLAAADAVPGPRVEPVVGRAEQAHERERRERGERRAVDEVPARELQEPGDEQDRADDEKAAHRRGAFLDVVGLGAIEPDALAHPHAPQDAQEQGHREDDERERDEDALDDRLRAAHGRLASVRPSSASGSTSRSSAAPRDALTSTTSPGRTMVRQCLGRRVTVGDRHDRRTVESCVQRPVRDPARPRADDDEPVDDRGRVAPDPAMRLRAVVPELEHLAEDGDPAPGKRREEVERGDDRIRGGVVGIIEDRHLAADDERGSMRRPGRSGQTGRDLVEREAGRDPDRGGGQRVVHAMPAERRGRDRPPLASDAQVEGHPVDAERAHVIGTDVGGRSEAIREDARPRVRAHPTDALVVGVQDGPAIRREGLDELALAGFDRVEGPGSRQVHATHGGDDPDRGLREPGQQRDLTGDVEAHLEDHGLVLGAKTKQREGQADLVVEVALAAQHRAADGEDLGDLLLGGGLREGAGDADDERVEALAPGCRDGAQGVARIGHPNDRRLPAAGDHRRSDRREPVRRQRFGDDECPGAGRGRRLEETMPVGVFTREREEGLTAANEPRIDGTAGDREGPSGDQLAVGPARQLVGGDGHGPLGATTIGADGDALRRPGGRLCPARPLCHRGHSRTRLSA